MGVVEADGDGLVGVSHLEDGESLRIEVEIYEDLLVCIGYLAIETVRGDLDSSCLYVVLKKLCQALDDMALAGLTMKIPSTSRHFLISILALNLYDFFCYFLMEPPIFSLV